MLDGADILCWSDCSRDVRLSLSPSGRSLVAVRKRTSDPDAARAVRETSRVCSFALTFFFSFYGTAPRSGLSTFLCGLWICRGVMRRSSADMLRSFTRTLLVGTLQQTAPLSRLTE